MYYDYLDTVLGKIYLLADNQGLRQLTVGSGGFCPDSSWEHSPEFMQQFISQLKEYLQGQRKTFTLSLAPKAHPFNNKSGKQSPKSRLAHASLTSKLPIKFTNPQRCRPSAWPGTSTRSLLLSPVTGFRETTTSKLIAATVKI